MVEKRINRNQWTRFLYPLSLTSGKKVKSMTFNLQASHESGIMNITDLQLQVGKIISAQVPHTTEFLFKKHYGVDEATNIKNVIGNNGLPAQKHGVQPLLYEGMRNRAFNIVGRGHEVIALPNTYHEDYKEELLTSGLDIKLYAKENFDLLRISTNDGALVPDRKYSSTGPLAEHSLNYKYTREFYFGAGLADQEIILSASQGIASLNGVNVPVGRRKTTFADGEVHVGRQRLMVAPFGSFRLRIEFYKKVTEALDDGNGGTVTLTYYKDVGIGYYGTAEFVQVKGNHTF